MIRKFTRQIKTSQSRYRAIIEKKDITQQCSYNLELELEDYLISINALTRITPEGNDTNVVYEVKDEYSIVLGANIIAIIGKEYLAIENRVLFTHTEGNNGTSKKIQLKKTDFDAKNDDKYKWFVDLYNKNIENILFITLVDEGEKTITFDLELSEEIFVNPHMNWQEMSYSIDELATILRNMSNEYDKVLGVHLFGIRFGAYIKNNKINVKDIISKANIGDFIVELHKGIKLSSYVVEGNCDLDSFKLNEDVESNVNPTYWICDANAKFFDHVGAFEKNGMIDWCQDNHFSKANIGDIVFLYSSRPEKKVKYKCVITKKDIAKTDKIQDLEFWVDPSIDERYNGLYVRFELVKESDDERLSLPNLFNNGLKGAPQGAFKLDDERLSVAHYIDSIFEGKEEIDEKLRLHTGTNIILYGVPGAGKSYTIDTEYTNDNTKKERVVFHPDYTYSDFVGQILPKSEDGNVSYEFIPGPFTKIMRDARYNPTVNYILVIEEINRGNAPAIFGDIFQLLDRRSSHNLVDGLDKYGESMYGIYNSDVAKIVYGDSSHEVKIPSNLSIICTMNTSDQNVFTLDTAFQRRWNMRLIENSFRKDTKEEEEFAAQVILDTSVSWERFCETINKFILEKNQNMTSSEDKRLGTHFVNLEDLIIDVNEFNESATSKQRKIARLHNRKFPEKVIKYLWDDAFKFYREEIFNSGYNSLEQIIKAFTTKTKDDRFDIFKDTIKADIVKKSN